MSLWTRFLDWILGREIMSIDDLKAIEDASLSHLKDMFDDMNAKIDMDADGMVSVREAWVLIRGTFSVLKAAIKGLMK